MNELAAALVFEIARCAARANEQAGRLQNIGDQAFDMTGEISREAVSKDLRQRSSAIRGIVAHALSVLAELQCEAGRLDAIAILREAEELEQVGDLRPR